MTLELFHATESQPEPQETTEERLTRERLDLQREMAFAAAFLCAANELYNDVIARTIAKNEEIKTHHVDVSFLLRQLQPASGMNERLFGRLKDIIEEDSISELDSEAALSTAPVETAS